MLEQKSSLNSFSNLLFMKQSFFFFFFKGICSFTKNIVRKLLSQHVWPCLTLEIRGTPLSYSDNDIFNKFAELCGL